MPKKFLVVDDEQIARERIVAFLREDPRLGLQDHVLEAENGLRALDIIASENPDVVFLDVQMPGLNGFDVLRQVESRNFQVVFQTAFDEFAVKAFEESACDYLLKPFPQERFTRALDRALLAVNHQEALQKLELSLRQNRRFIEKLSYRQGGKLKVLPINEIICFVSQDHCTTAYSSSGEHLVDLSIAHLAENLNPSLFIRSHRNSIVAIAAVKSVGQTDDPTLELSNGMKLPVSRSNRKAVLAALKS